MDGVGNFGSPDMPKWMHLIRLIAEVDTATTISVTGTDCRDPAGVLWRAACRPLLFLLSNVHMVQIGAFEVVPMNLLNYSVNMQASSVENSFAWEAMVYPR
jgi:hypothetical protein